jgi:hypothetical protein
MPDRTSLTRATLRTPKAAALAGIAFSVLLSIALFLLRLSVPVDPNESGAWLATNATTVAIALNLIPFSGIAFLWFMGVLRDRLGQNEDRFFATVFMGSGILLLAMVFSAAALAGAIIIAYASKPEELVNSSAFHLARATAYNMMNIYAVKMAGMFMISTSTITLFTEIAPRWIAFVGFGLALMLLFASSFFVWAFFAFPMWVLLMSIYILLDNLGRRAA